jgi:hypothetical protein
MNLSELVEHSRCSVLRDTAPPFLWSDTEIILYLNEAERLFARRTHCLSDSTSDLTTFNTVVGTADYTLDPRIVFVSEIGVVLDPGETYQSYHALRDNTRGQQFVTFSAGRPLCYTAQASSGTIRFVPVPDAIYKIIMTVARKPLNILERGADTPEINEDYHLALCDYVAYRALSNNDVDGTNQAAGQSFLDRWNTTIRDAKRDLARTRGGISPQARNNWTGKRASIRYR